MRNQEGRRQSRRRERRRKNSLSKIVALCLVSALSVGLTYAYLTDKQTVTNTLTVGDVKVSIEEPEWSKPGANHEIAPGTTVSKDPKVTNTGKNPCWVRIKLHYDENILELIGVDNIGWKKDADGYYYYNEVVPVGGETSSLFTEVKMKETVKEESITEGKVNLIVNAEAVQANGFGTYKEAFKAAESELITP
ncbi:alternate signal-mediated exported protein, CPF_0494 family [Clostridium collagenovorans DSM 3089]|uniref:Alternate signal-mediated exported protein, CPF_0494 family n=1 Tax=Clostridium collagenovorans DSM 3089 TaxID=1121306 RepID=A0A1M5XGX3_9CLOT|nr:TasA family protein [Clostridium collagenovorans]SHH99061.1 alternate signal-mediated exported protein, CPF_0494 family [Clostridium collagenovorans DSM 3089]